MNRLQSITIVSIINMVCGFLGGMMTGFNAVFMARIVYAAVADQRIGTAAFINAWILCTLVLAFTASVLLMVGGIGTSKMRPWGRRVTIGFAVYAGLLAVFLAGVSVLYVAPALNEMGAKPLPRGLVTTWKQALWYVVIWATYPCFLLLFFFRPRIQTAFKGGLIDEQN